MSSIFVALLAFVGFIVAYHTYGRFLADKLFGVDPNRKTPAVEVNDGVDYVPTKKEVLLGHHFTSIAGTGPIVGPAIAIIWGWVPALLWVVFGSIFIGAVHDLGALILSVRNRGSSIGDLSEKVVSRRVKRVFLYIILLALFIVLAVFALVIATIFSLYPESVLAVWLEIPIALWAGYMIYKRGASLWKVGLIAVVLMYATVILGAYVPIRLPDNLPLGMNSVVAWSLLLFLYAYIASVLPVHRLLQPRDYINGHELYIVMALLVIGILVAHPVMVAPGFNFQVPSPSEVGWGGWVHALITAGGVGIQGAPAFIPFLFITIACGAISGFHCMVSSGTTSKQLASEKDARLVGYGAMLLEGALATLVIIACGAAIGLKPGANGLPLGAAAFAEHYSSWASAGGLKATLGAFVDGSAQLIMALGIPRNIAVAIMGVMVASFAATTLDTATRIQRYVITEIGSDLGIASLQNRHAATLLAVGSAAILALQKGGTGGLTLWPLFGATNQLLGALTLLVLTVWLAKQQKAMRYTAVPMVFMLTMTAWALGANLVDFFARGQWHLFVIGAIVTVLEVWMVAESLVHLGAARRRLATEGIGAGG
ncbi:MAG: carbon starvation protein A [Candidatus Poribacteria bacterium]|nr:MAG: carbon starvation protein A [Candidatus Poribacteria bacterium]